MSYETIKVDATEEDFITVTISRPDANNALNNTLITEIMAVITSADEGTKVIIIQGQNGVFCTGMDFNLFGGDKRNFTSEEAYEFSSLYMNLLTTFATTNKVIVAKLDGKVLAGGTGLVAAADLVYASPRTTLSLSEALWGLLPANVMPYLIRRVGFQTAYRMTLTTETLTAETAQKYHLVDEVLDPIDEQLARKLLRIRYLQQETIADLKNYFNGMYPVTKEMCELAINTLATLLCTPRVQNNIGNFVQHGVFPWSQS